MLIDWEYASMGIAYIDIASSGVIQPVDPHSRMISDYINELWTRVKRLTESGK